MGRWSQQHRRGGGGGAPPPPVVPPSLVVATDLGGGVLELTFNGDVTATPAGAPETGSMSLDATPDLVTTAANTGDNVITVTQDQDPSSGMTLTWNSQPPWILTAINLATSVVVS